MYMRYYALLLQHFNFTSQVIILALYCHNHNHMHLKCQSVYVHFYKRPGCRFDAGISLSDVGSKLRDSLPVIWYSLAVLQHLNSIPKWIFLRFKALHLRRVTEALIGGASSLYAVGKLISAFSIVEYEECKVSPVPLRRSPIQNHLRQELVVCSFCDASRPHSPFVFHGT